MAIYYSPFPSTQPPATLSQYVLGDYYVNSTGAAVRLQFNNVLKRNAWVSYKPTGSLSAPFIPTTIPELAASALTSVIDVTQGQAVNTQIANVFGGSSIATQYTTAGTFVGYNVTTTPALPTGLSLSFSFSTISQTNAENTSFLFNSAIVSLTGTPTQSIPATIFTVSITDSSGLLATTTFRLTVEASGVSLLTTSSLIPSRSLTQGIATTSFIPVVANGGTSPLLYSISPSIPSGLTFNTTTGTISGTPTVFQSSTQYTISVTDSSVPIQTSSNTFSLTIESVPVVTSLSVSSRNLTQGQEVTSFRPVIGSGGYGTLTYSISPSLPSGLSFNSVTGAITGTPTVPLDATNFTVTVSDQNVPPQTSSKTFSLTVIALPQVFATQLISSQSLSVNTPFNSFTPVAGSGGFGALTYSISPALPSGLSFNTSTGLISGIATSLLSQTSFTVTVTDSGSQTASASFNLTVVTIPIALTKNIETRTLIKNVSSSPFIPISGSGGFGALTYSISPALPSGLTLSTSNGAITGASSANLAQTSFTVTVTDETPQSNSETFNLIINDPALLTITKVINTETIVEKQTVVPFRPIVHSGGHGTITYSIDPTLPSSLNFNTANGAISGTALGFNANSTPYTITVTDQAQQSVNNTFNLVINTEPLVVTTDVSNLEFVKDVLISSVKPVSAQGGTKIYTYSVSPSLPTNLTLSTSTGVISGTPNVTTSQTQFTITVTDSLSQTKNSTFRLTVSEPPALTTTQQVASTSLTRLVTQANFTPVTASGGYGTITFSINPSLPVGLVFNQNNGNISGVSSAVIPQTTYTVTAKDSLGQSSSKTFTIEVVGPALIVSTSVSSVTTTQFLETTPFTPITFTGGTPPVSYVVSPSLPTGLNINSLTGTISGIPTTTLTNTSFTITVTDSLGVFNSNTFNLTVEEPEELIATQNVANVVYTINESLASFRPVTGFGGEGTLSYSISPALPFGLSYSTTTGFVSGTPLDISDETEYTVTVTDSISQTASNTFNVTVNPLPLSFTINNQGLTFTLYKQVTPINIITGVGGFGSYTYTVSPALPTGLSLNSGTGAIFGTPTVESAFTEYTFTITDSENQTVSFSADISVVDDSVPELLGVLLQNEVILISNTSANVQPVSTFGGFGQIFYSISPDLPNGLSFNTSTGFITGTPTTTLANTEYFVTVTDSVPQSDQKSFYLIVQAPGTGSIDFTARKIASDAFNEANTKLNLTGGTITGDLEVTGNITLDKHLYDSTGSKGNVGETLFATTQGTKWQVPAALIGIDNVLYVSKDGNDSNDGKSIANAFLTIKAALDVANVGTTVFVKSGNYIEDNPVTVPAGVSIVGDNLRTVSVRPLNTNQDLFYVNNGCYLTGMTFRDHVTPAAAIAFNPNGSAGNITTSPYVQNCSSITTTGTGMRIDGSHVTGALRSMVLDAYTQFNQGGIGVHILNSGYAQLVSLFTICCTESVLCESGGQCSLTNSNSSFGTRGLVARGTSPLLFTGSTNGINPNINRSNVVVDGLTTKPVVNDVASFDGGNTFYTIVSTTGLESGQTTITFAETLPTSIADNTSVEFYRRSFISASGHTFEYVGSGTNLAEAIPEAGGEPIAANEVVQENGGKVFYSSTDQFGNFQIGGELSFINAKGVIEGRTFNRSLFTVMTPYILALEG
jgi:hypothetical protein